MDCPHANQQHRNRQPALKGSAQPPREPASNWAFQAQEAASLAKQLTRQPHLPNLAYIVEWLREWSRRRVTIRPIFAKSTLVTFPPTNRHSSNQAESGAGRFLARTCDATALVLQQALELDSCADGPRSPQKKASDSAQGSAER